MEEIKKLQKRISSCCSDEVEAVLSLVPNLVERVAFRWLLINRKAVDEEGNPSTLQQWENILPRWRKILILWAAARGVQDMMTSPKESIAVDQAVWENVRHCDSMLERNFSPKSSRRWKSRLQAALWNAGCLTQYGKRLPTTGKYVLGHDGYQIWGE